MTTLTVGLLPVEGRAGEPARMACPGCGNEIVPDVCHCGITKSHHTQRDHPFVPMGCDCKPPALRTVFAALAADGTVVRIFGNDRDAEDWLERHQDGDYMLLELCEHCGADAHHHHPECVYDVD